jgi:hypothetical protein
MKGPALDGCPEATSSKFETARQQCSPPGACFKFNQTTPGHVIMRVIIFALIGVVFHGHMTWGHTLNPPSKGHYYPNCSQSTCNPVNFTVLKSSDWTQGQIISIRIDGKALTPVLCYTLS